jgi:hypothetical protein
MCVFTQLVQITVLQRIAPMDVLQRYSIQITRSTYRPFLPRLILLATSGETSVYEGATLLLGTLCGASPYFPWEEQVLIGQTHVEHELGQLVHEVI